MKKREIKHENIIQIIIIESQIDLRYNTHLLMKIVKKILNAGKTVAKKFFGFAEKKPLTTFFSLLGLLLLLIVIGNFIRRPKAQPAKPTIVKNVSTYHIGKAAKITLQGQIEKAGVLQISALAPGVVQSIFATEGSIVKKGETLISIASNYSGGNALTLARQIAQKQNENIEDTFQTQKDTIGRQRDLVNQTETNFEKMRDITNQSINDTQSLINLNNDIISTLDAGIAADTTGTASASLKQLKSQFSSANLQLNSALRNAQYQVDTNNPPTAIAQAQRDIALKQLDVQEKALNLSLEISRLQLQIARVNEATMYPSAPFNSEVQHVFVRQGQMVTPGTPLFTITAVVDPPLNVYVYTSKEISEKVSKLETSTIYLGNKKLELQPTFISKEAIQGNLYTIMYSLPQENYGDVTDHGYVSVEIPLGYPDSGAAIPFIPLDAVYQTQENAFVFVADAYTVRAKIVSLGSVFGNYVEVNSGLKSGDAIILDRSVVEGDVIRIQN